MRVVEDGACPDAEGESSVWVKGQTELKKNTVQ